MLSDYVFPGACYLRGYTLPKMKKRRKDDLWQSDEKSYGGF